VRKRERERERDRNNLSSGKHAVKFASCGRHSKSKVAIALGGIATLAMSIE
jgi:hypothetical protein